ncbi:hypothetical protein [Streptomyces sp. x-19]|uniref:hypothetical protein n=1 Tax=Streptomyces sp. x-19 TaxID=2789280 RepID=UPI00397F6340
MLVDKLAALLAAPALALADLSGPWPPGALAIPSVAALLLPAVRDRLVRLARTVITYTAIVLLPRSPAEVIDLLYRGCRRDRVPLLRRDLVCTARELRKELEHPAGHSTDPDPRMSQGTFTFLFSLDDPAQWKPRRTAISSATPAMTARAHADTTAFVPPPGHRDLYRDLTAHTLGSAFRIVFGRPPTTEELHRLRPGIDDINDMVKNRSLRPRDDLRQRTWHETSRLIDAHLDDPRFLFHADPHFAALDHGARIDVAGADLLQSITVQTADLFGHMLLLRHEHPAAFDHDIDAAILETLRLHPLSDSLFRTPDQGNPWLASLVMVHRHNWPEPDRFCPTRWRHTPRRALAVYSAGPRTCPSFKVSEIIATRMLHDLHQRGIRITPHPRLRHERTFYFGLPATITHHGTPSAHRPPRLPTARLWARRYAARTLFMARKREIW